MMNENKTLEYYNKNADNFAKTTINVDFCETQNRFSTLLPEHGYILDFGCGSGRDTKYFLEQGFYVDATDGSEEMCHIDNPDVPPEKRPSVIRAHSFPKCLDFM